MEFLGYLVRCLIELAALGRLLITNSLNFLALYMKSRTALTAEVLFLRKQLAYYQERKAVPRRFDNASRYLLVLLSRCFAWKDALVNVTPRTLIGWHKDESYRKRVTFPAQMPLGGTESRLSL